MRSNGLTARAYTPIADLDPVLADAMLDDLRTQGVAAYTKPVESPTTAGFDRPEFRISVRDRLYVDSTASSRVRDLLDMRHPGLLDDPNEDLAWAQIVAGFDLPSAPGDRPWPDDEDLPPQSPTTGLFTTPRPDVDDTPRTRLGERTRPDHDDTAAPRYRRRSDRGHADVPSDDIASSNDAAHDSSDALAFIESTQQRRDRPEDDGFVPEPPPPLPTLAPYKLLAWIGVVGGPLLLLGCTMFGGVPGWLIFLGVVGFVGGFITLVATMSDRDDEWGSDDGAVV